MHTHTLANKDHEMSYKWVTLIQKQGVLFSFMRQIHINAISGSAEPCLQNHTQKTNAFVDVSIQSLKQTYDTYDCAFCHCYRTTIITQKNHIKLSHLPGKCCFVNAPSNPHGLLFFNISQLSHSVPKVLGLVLSSVYQRTAPNVSLINDCCGWVWFITDLTHGLAHMWVILVLRGLLRGSSSKPHQNRTTKQKASVR